MDAPTCHDGKAEKLLSKHFPKGKRKDGKRWTPQVNLVRYADDFIDWQALWDVRRDNG
jgi:hypothetical protein